MLHPLLQRSAGLLPTDARGSLIDWQVAHLTPEGITLAPQRSERPISANGKLNVRKQEGEPHLQRHPPVIDLRLRGRSRGDVLAEPALSVAKADPI